MRLFCKALFATLMYSGILCFISCSDTQRIFNVKDGLSGAVDINLDSIYKVYNIVSLKSNDKYLLTRNPSIIYADDSNFIISSDNNVYLYSTDGTFIREIGKYGKGHGEHGKVTSCFYDSKKKNIYVCTFGDEIYCYSIEGEYIDKTTIRNKERGSVSRAFGLVGNSRIIGIKNVYTGEGVKCYATIYDEQGNAEKDNLLYSDNLSFRMTTESFPIAYSMGDSFRVKLPFDDRLFSISLNKDVEYENMGLGDLLPTRDLIENCDKRKELYNDKCQILDIKETAKHIYLICYSAMKYYSMILDKEAKNVIFSKCTDNPKINGALVYKEEDVCFWPSFCSGDEIYCLVAKDGDFYDSKESITNDSGFYVLKIKER